MNYWWANQKQTFRHEVSGGYLWSPKRNKNGASNRGYDAMRKVVPGDIVFSFANAQIIAIGIVASYCYEFPKPNEFGAAGANWEDIGWRVDVSYKRLASPLRVKNHIKTLGEYLPNKYSPLQKNGNGNQAYYLYDIDKEFAIALAQFLGPTELEIVRGYLISDLSAFVSSELNVLKWEDAIEESIRTNDEISTTTKTTLIESRRGQGKFRQKLLEIESRCRVTTISNPKFLIASHTKPWRDSNNEERLDPENGFMLSPDIDHLFDRGFISFDNGGELLISVIADLRSLEKMGIETRSRTSVGNFTLNQKRYLDWHRDNIYLA